MRTIVLLVLFATVVSALQFENERHRDEALSKRIFALRELIGGFAQRRAIDLFCVHMILRLYYILIQ